jgi:hypothetical protein
MMMAREPKHCDKYRSWCHIPITNPIWTHPDPTTGKKGQQFFIPSSRFPNEHCFLGGFKASPVCPRTSNIHIKIISTGLIILTVENWRVLWKTCTSATSSTTNLTWTDLRSTQGLCGYRTASNRLSHGMAISAVRGPELRSKIQFVPFIKR